MTDRDNGFKQQMAVNVKWVGIGMVFSYILQLSVWAVLARFLRPESFGALGIALAFSSLAVILNELGFGTALIQRKSLSEVHKTITFWICIFMGILFLCIAVLFSSFIAKYFQNPVIVPLAIAFFVKNLIDCFGIVNEAVLKRELLFRKLTFIEIWSSILFGIVALVMVFKGFDIFSLVYGYMAKSLLRVILLWNNITFKIFGKFDRKSFNELFHYGKNIIGSRIVSYFANNADIVIIGKVLGPASLGYYSMALNLVNFPRLKLSSLICEVAFPAFSRVQERLDDVRHAYSKMIRYASVINFPLLIGLMLISAPFVNTIYSSKWIAMVVPLQILCVYGACFSITTICGVIYNSIGCPEYSFKISLFMLIGTITAVLSGIRHGLSGVAIALSIYALATNILAHLWVKRIIKMGFIFYFRSIVPAMISCVVMSLGLVIISFFQRNVFMLSDLWFLLVMVVSGAIIYLLTLFFVSCQTLKEMIEIAGKIFWGIE